MPTLKDAESRRRGWEDYWSEATALQEVSQRQGRSIWEQPPEVALQVDLPRMLPWLDKTLPILDFGCGNGPQTPSLAEHFERVIATDVSQAAIDYARKHHAHPRVEYGVLDAFDEQAIEALHERIGDMNIYMRFVLHQFDSEDRVAMARGVGKLLGQHGVLYSYELDSSTPELLGRWSEEHGVPLSLSRVMKTGTTPGGVDRESARTAFPPNEYEYLDEGETSVTTTIFGTTLHPDADNSEGIPWTAPTYYAVIRKR